MFYSTVSWGEGIPSFSLAHGTTTPTPSLNPLISGNKETGAYVEQLSFTKHELYTKCMSVMLQGTLPLELPVVFVYFLLLGL